ncbi:MAG TPA: carboxypeptidase regulatory-like domain-containing protein, partial [Chloroflexi bacterium]|nr:carboxypeptidase regulatory-like domain-containing protein [Chloroflexota bacterium]
MKHKRILWLAAVPVMALLLLAAIFTWTQPAAAEPAGTLGGMVSGTVTSPRGYPLPAGTVVRLFEPGSASAFGEAVPDLNDGTFLLGPVPNGLYVLKAVPPESSGLTQSEFVPVSVYNAPVDVGEVPLTEPQVFGTVVAPDGSTPAPASVTVYLADGQPIQVVDAPGGAFSLGGLPAGTYGVQAFPWGTQPYFRSVIQSFTVSEGVTQSITVTLRAADLWGVALDPDNNPIRGAKVVAADRFGHHQVALSDGNGFWTLGGLPAGDYWLSALPPLKNSGLLPPIPVSATIPGADNPYTL